jgi:catalase-peroxidase
LIAGLSVSQLVLLLGLLHLLSVDLINGRSKWSTDTSCTSKDWEVNNPVQLKKVLEVFDHIQAEFNKAQSDDRVSSRLIVLGGCAAIEKAAKALVIL